MVCAVPQYGRQRRALRHVGAGLRGGRGKRPDRGGGAFASGRARRAQRGRPGGLRGVRPALVHRGGGEGPGWKGQGGRDPRLHARRLPGAAAGPPVRAWRARLLFAGARLVCARTRDPAAGFRPRRRLVAAGPCGRSVHGSLRRGGIPAAGAARNHGARRRCGDAGAVGPRQPRRRLHRPGAAARAPDLFPLPDAMLHHLYGRDSERVVYGGFWREATRLVLRYGERT